MIGQHLAGLDARLSGGVPERKALTHAHFYYRWYAQTQNSLINIKTLLFDHAIRRDKLTIELGLNVKYAYAYFQCKEPVYDLLVVVCLEQYVCVCFEGWSLN